MNKIKLAVEILSGITKYKNLSGEDFLTLGYNPYDAPTKIKHIKIRASEILLNYFDEIEGNIISLHEGLANTQGVDYDY